MDPLSDEGVMSSMRFTIIDERQTVSFLAPPHLLKALAATCSRGAATVKDVVSLLEEYDLHVARAIRDGLAVNAEHATSDDAVWTHRRIEESPDDPGPFAVVDDVTRQASLKSGALGMVVFNLRAKRIVQVENSYAPLQRSDRGRLRLKGRPVSTFYSYTLPDDWSIVP
jgi:hypothetical protein